MDTLGMVLNNTCNVAVEKNLYNDADYTDESGFAVCGKCRARKQMLVKFPANMSGERKMPIACDCQREENERINSDIQRQDFLQRVERLRRDGLTDTEYLKWTFEFDDKQDINISNACRKYVDEWPEMRTNNVGLLFFGNVGTGKSFYACCIANELLNRCVPTLVTNFPTILGKLQTAGYSDNFRKELFDNLHRYELVVIDDLGVERSTEYALEQVYSVIDTRYRSGKPLIITTNLSPGDVKNPANLSYKRIYDRIMQNSLLIKMIGTSRRAELGEQKRDKYQKFLGL